MVLICHINDTHYICTSYHDISTILGFLESIFEVQQTITGYNLCSRRYYVLTSRQAVKFYHLQRTSHHHISARCYINYVSQSTFDFRIPACLHSRFCCEWQSSCTRWYKVLFNESSNCPSAYHFWQRFMNSTPISNARRSYSKGVWMIETRCCKLCFDEALRC